MRKTGIMGTTHVHLVLAFDMSPCNGESCVFCLRCLIAEQLADSHTQSTTAIDERRLSNDLELCLCHSASALVDIPN